MAAETRGQGGDTSVEGYDLYRSRPINAQMRRRFPHTLYYAKHFDEESHRLVFAFLGPDGCYDQPDRLFGLEAQTQWNRFVDVMVRDPLMSGLRVERIGSHRDIDDCLVAARADARAGGGQGAVTRKAEPATADAMLIG